MSARIKIKLGKKRQKIPTIKKRKIKIRIKLLIRVTNDQIKQIQILKRL